MQFIPVTADQTNSQGTVGQSHAPRVSFRINSDLVGAIKGTDVLLKGGNILSIGGNYYTNIRLAENVKVESL